MLRASPCLKSRDSRATRLSDLTRPFSSTVITAAFASQDTSRPLSLPRYFSLTYIFRRLPLLRAGSLSLPLTTPLLSGSRYMESDNSTGYGNIDLGSLKATREEDEWCRKAFQSRTIRRIRCTGRVPVTVTWAMYKFYSPFLLLATPAQSYTIRRT